MYSEHIDMRFDITLIWDIFLCVQIEIYNDNIIFNNTYLDNYKQEMKHSTHSIVKWSKYDRFPWLGHNL